jgi:hypothetical protein
MDYRMVKQSWNSSVDNFFNFFYKISDFLRVSVDLFWAFFDIWYNFVMIFVNIFKYFYFMLLFIIDTMTMNRYSLFFWQKSRVRLSKKPVTVFDPSKPNPIPAMFGKSGGAVSMTVSAAGSAVASTTQAVKSMSAATITGSARPSGGRINIFRKIAEFFADIFKAVAERITRMFKGLFTLLARKLTPVKEDEVAGRKSLLDQY